MVGSVDLGDFTMQYASFGHGDKTMVMIPGLSLKPVSPLALMIEKSYEVFTKDYTVYLLDRRDNAPSDYTAEEMVEDTYMALKELGVESAYFLGASQGGAITMELAIMHPDMVKGMAIGSSAAYVNEMGASVLETWLDLSNKRESLSLAEHMIDVIYSKNTLSANRDSLIKAFSNLNEEELVQFINLCEGFRSYDIRDRLGEIKCPTIVIGCEGDKVFGADASREIYEGISTGNVKCELYIYSNSYGHAVYDEAPDYKERVYNFFENLR